MLAEAMDRTEPDDEVRAIDRHDFSSGKDRPDNARRLAVPGVVEGRHEDASVDDEKIRVTARQPVPLPITAPLRHRQRYDIERIAILITQSPQGL